MVRDVSICFAAGVFGGLANSLFVWAGGHYGLAQVLEVAITPAWTPAWLYPRLVWGGLWGVLFLIPVLKRTVLARGALMSLAPSAVQLLVIFPTVLGKGVWGLDLGALTPVYVLAANVVWGVAAAVWLMSAGGRSESNRIFWG